MAITDDATSQLQLLPRTFQLEGATSFGFTKHEQRISIFYVKGNPIRLRETVILALVLAGLGAGTLPMASAAPGDLDPTFGTGGKVVTDFMSGTDYVQDIGIQADGKIVLGGRSEKDGNSDFAIARYLSNGTLDSSFASGGQRLTPIGDAGDFGLALAIQPDGKILQFGNAALGATGTDFALVRYLTDGSLDPDFGTSGIATFNFAGSSFDLAGDLLIQPDGKIVLGGESNDNFAFIRCLANGALDSSFGIDGKVLIDFGGQDGIHGIALQPDGKIVACGESFTTNGNSLEFAVARLDTDGELDPGFNGSGGQLIGFGPSAEIANGITVQSDGKIVIVGSTRVGGDSDFVLVRFLADGQLDAGFGNGGGAISPISEDDDDDAYQVHAGGDGKLLVCGVAINDNRFDFALRAYLANGSPDAGFGSAGIVLTPIGTGTDESFAMAIQDDGKIVTAGYTRDNTLVDFAAARHEGYPVVPRTLPAWRQQYFGTVDNAGDAANDFDFDRDGLINILEFAFDQDPTLATSRMIPPTVLDGGELCTSFSAPPGLSGVNYGAEWSASLGAGSWTALADLGAGNVHKFSVPIAERSSLWLRWRITPE